MSKNPCTEIEALAREVEPLVQKVRAQAEDLIFERICRLDEREKISKLNFPGLYLIEIRADLELYKTVPEWAAAFKADWDNDAPAMHFTPGIKARRVAKHSKLKAWMPLYLGIRKTKVSDRIQQHIDLPAAANTGGLKLRSRNHINLRDLRLSAINLNFKSYDAVMKTVESVLRDKYHPIAGN